MGVDKMILLFYSVLLCLLFYQFFSPPFTRIARKLFEVKKIQEFLDIKFGENEKEKDDFMFEHAREINIAVFQRIIYQEYLPQVLGDKFMEEYGLLSPQHQYSRYDEYINPMITTEFSTFAYR